ncbi:hypothetical protein ACFWEJ_19610, partial [Promicromonospora sp. NPDC060204]
MLGGAVLRKPGGGTSGGTSTALRSEASGAAGNWLKGSHGNAGWIPKRIKDAMNAGTYGSWKEFREAFWKTVAADDELAGQFSRNNR